MDWGNRGVRHKEMLYTAVSSAMRASTSLCVNVCNFRHYPDTIAQMLEI